MERDMKVTQSHQMVRRGTAAVQLMPNCNDGIVTGNGVPSCAMSSGSPAAVPPANADSALPLTVSLPTCTSVMTDEQLETLRRQISVYATICSQLVEMHKAVMAQQAMMPSMIVGQHLPFDPVLGARSSGRQRWTPSQIQLQILEKFFEEGNGTPSKQKIKEITAELGNHGQISETNVYNWFQNRKARAKRKAQCVTTIAESDLDMEEVESRKDKRSATEVSQDDALTKAFRPQVDSDTVFDEAFIQGSHRDFSTMVVLIDGNPWEVPSGALDLRGSFGEASALIDSRRQIVPTDETGFTISPLKAGENYNLIRLTNDTGQNAPGIVSQE